MLSTRWDDFTELPFPFAHFKVANLFEVFKAISRRWFLQRVTDSSHLYFVVRLIYVRYGNFQDAQVVNFDRVTREVYYPSKEELTENYRIIVTTLVTAGR